MPPMTKILFYIKSTWEVLDNADNALFVRSDGTVWRDNYKTWESQEASIGFDDCVEPCPHIAWGVDE